MQYLVILLIEFVVLFLLSQLLIKNIYVLLYKLFKHPKVVIRLFALLFYPGTIIHEMAHFLVAEIILVHTGKISLTPQIDGKYLKLGSVQIQKTDPFRRALIGVAPFLTGTFIITLTFFYVISVDHLHTIWSIFISLYIIFEVSNTMFSSRRDMEGTLELVILIVIISVLLYLVGVRFDMSKIPIYVISYFKTADIFMLIPLLINVSIIGVCKVWTNIK